MPLSLKRPLCFFDLETTGINITNDRIIEIAVIKLMPNGEVHRKVNLVNPTIPIPAESTAIHGISEEDVVGKPRFKELAKEYARFMEGCDLSGFNIYKFDLPLLVEEFLRAEVEFDYARKRVVDSQRIFHLMEKRNLAAAVKFYCGHEMVNSHSAESDAEASMDILLAQVARYENQKVEDGLGNLLGEIKGDVDALTLTTASEMVDLAGRMIKNKKGQVVFNFGKHKGKVVLDVFKEEPTYYDWMMQGDFALDTKRRLTEVKLSALQLKLG